MAFEYYDTIFHANSSKRGNYRKTCLHKYGFFVFISAYLIFGKDVHLKYMNELVIN